MFLACSLSLRSLIYFILIKNVYILLRYRLRFIDKLANKKSLTYTFFIIRTSNFEEVFEHSLKCSNVLNISLAF